MTEELIVGLHIPGPPALESRFTHPTERCPAPGNWTSTDGDSTEVEVSQMVYGLVRGLQPFYCVETGSAWGQTSEQIGRALQDNGHGDLETLDDDPERVEATKERCAGLPVSAVHADSMTWVPRGRIDFAFFDSLYELRVPEFKRYLPWMRNGTIVAFHDSAPEHGSHRIESGRDLQEEIEFELTGIGMTSAVLRVINLPTPRGITIGEVINL